MERKAESLDFKIDGLLYRLRADENAWYMRKIAQEAEQMISEIKRSNPRSSAQSRSVLALINALDRLYKSFDQISQLESEIKHLREQQAALRSVLNRQQEELDEAKTAVRFYRNLTDRLQESILEAEQKPKKQQVTVLETKQIDLFNEADFELVAKEGK
ncbi:MAG: cell division protein ZapA [Eubacteriales bacterium]|nr:cell division protein ZapA [Eubacteriales bacterium]